MADEKNCLEGHVFVGEKCDRCGRGAVGAEAPVETPVEEKAIDPSELTTKELRAELDKLGVAFKASDSKAVLIKKLKEASAEDSEDEESEDDDDLDGDEELPDDEDEDDEI